MDYNFLEYLMGDQPPETYEDMWLLNDVPKRPKRPKPAYHLTRGTSLTHVLLSDNLDYWFRAIEPITVRPYSPRLSDPIITLEDLKQQHELVTKDKQHLPNRKVITKSPQIRTQTKNVAYRHRPRPELRHCKWKNR